ncbi:hypothetical protein FFI11_016965 [Oerskovia sp. KBS0722]|nr:hypothetical protein FFI11_016965 [Oerskovia sp. KBS0722]
MSEFDSYDGFDLDPVVSAPDGMVQPMSTPSIILVTRVTWTIATILTTNACGSTPTKGRC